MDHNPLTVVFTNAFGFINRYDGTDSAYKGERVVARAYVDYTDANGFGRRGYHTYSDSKFAGGCRTSFNGAYNAVNAAYDALARVA